MIVFAWQVKDGTTLLIRAEVAKLCHRMGVWGYGRKNPSHTPNLPYPHTKWKPKGKAELYGLMHGSVTWIEMPYRARLQSSTTAWRMCAKFRPGSDMSHRDKLMTHYR